MQSLGASYAVQFGRQTEPTTQPLVHMARASCPCMLLGCWINTQGVKYEQDLHCRCEKTLLRCRQQLS